MSTHSQDHDDMLMLPVHDAPRSVATSSSSHADDDDDDLGMGMIMAKHAKPPAAAAATATLVDVADDDFDDEQDDDEDAEAAVPPFEDAPRPAASGPAKAPPRSPSIGSLASWASQRSRASVRRGGGGGGNNRSNARGDAASFTPEEVSAMKQEMLYQLDRLQQKGVKLHRAYTMASSYDEIKAELERIKRDRELMSSLRFQRMILSTCVTGIEFLNTRYDPFDIKLDGWSESIHDNMTDYDDIFEELHEKYKGKARMAPELKLMFMLGGSAVQFHLTNTLFKSMPDLGSVMKQNPELMRQFAAATVNAASGGAGPSGGGSADGAGIGGMLGGLGKLFGAFGGGGASSSGAAAPAMPPPPPPPSGAKMRGPSSMGDILKDLEGGVEVMSTLSDNDSLLSATPSARAAGRGGRKRNGQQQQQRRTLDL